MALDLVDQLRQYVKICDTHAGHIELALQGIQPILPLTPQIIGQLERRYFAELEVLISRFAKLQDCMGSKIFPLTLEAILDEKSVMTVIDRVHKLEKIDFLENAQIWIELRESRNFIAHEYPDTPDFSCQKIVEIINSTKILLEIWAHFKNKMAEKGMG